MRCLLKRLALTAPLCFAFAAFADAAQCPQGKLVPSNGDFGAQLGSSLALSGDYALLGAPYDNEAGSLTGALHFFEKAGGVWSEVQKLTASDIDELDRIGFSVALEGDLALAGSRYDEQAGYGTGAAYIFERVGGTWTETAKLLADDFENGAFFGQSVAVRDANLVVVGAHADDEIAVDAGSVYVFERQEGSWNQTAKLNTPDGLAEDQFGWDVSVSGSWIFVGARGVDDFGDATGAVYAYEQVGPDWIQRQKLLASDAAGPARFGLSVDVDGARVAIGAAYDEGNWPGGGAAYLFELSGGVWSETLKLTQSDPAPWDFFGQSVALHGNLLAVGALGEDDGGPQAGAVYVFEQGHLGWAETAKVVPPGLVGDDGVGAAVGIDESSLMVPARGDDSFLLNSGALHVYTPRDQYELLSPTAEVSVSAGGHQDFDLTTCPPRPGAYFFLLGSASGTDIGVSVDEFHIALNFDFYFLNTLTAPNFYPVPISQAALDVNGEGTARFELNPGTAPSFAGLTLHHAFGLIDPALGLLRETSAPIPLELVP